MARLYCYCCNSEITPANQCIAHVLPNCVGGSLKSEKLFCRNCDTRFGEDIDKALCEELKVVTNLLNIKRDRGKPPTIKGRLSGTQTEIILKAGQQPIRKLNVERANTGGTRSYRFTGKCSQ